MDTQSLSISSALTQLREGTISASELSSDCYQVINRLNPEINAFITVINPESGTKSIQSNNALSGIPLAIKDIYKTEGILTTAGTTFFRDFIPNEDAAAVERLKGAGAIITGKTNTHEIALGVTGVNPHYGSVRNPWDKTRICGGSSSGSAAAVASGMCLAAMGTDTGGSIRIPASLCGIVGLKPTYGRISVRGIFPLSWNLDHAGPLTKTVEDAAIMLQVLAGYDELDPASVNLPVEDYLSELNSGVKGWRVAVLTGDYAWECDSEVLDAVRAAAQVFESLGAQVQPVELNFLRDAALANSLMTQADAAAFHKDRLLEHPLGFGEDVRLRLQTGAAFTSSEYAQARRTQAEMRRRMEQFFQGVPTPEQGYDTLLLPTAPFTAPTIEGSHVLLLPVTPITAPYIEGSNALQQARRLTRFTAPFNLTGLPALSVPCGFSSTGLPIGLQIVCPAWNEKKLLQAGHAFEKATEWHKHKPML